ncbi:MAG: TerC family protein [Methanosarcinales archaeon]|nr:TerC family protein [Methanosarcinales archaeon]
MISDPVILWTAFNVGVLLLLALDLGVFHRRSHEIGIKESLIWSAIWTAVALAFNFAVFFWHGYDSALEFTAGYLIERTMSMDNLFVFLMIFTYLKVPAPQQYKVLFWGIMVALVMRAFFIITGVALVERFDWIIYVFGAFLIFTGIKMVLQKDETIDLEQNRILRLSRRVLPCTACYHGDKFFVKNDGKRFATPLFLVLVAVEITDLIFAMDSIPAVLAISLDPFIVYTSNIFAILGLRALYFALAGCAQIFHYLNYGISTILIFVGGKMVISDFYHIPVSVALGIIALILFISMVASLTRPARAGEKEGVIHNSER